MGLTSANRREVGKCAYTVANSEALTRVGHTQLKYRTIRLWKNYSIPVTQYSIPVTYWPNIRLEHNLRRESKARMP
jgi:hypothetical protein